MDCISDASEGKGCYVVSEGPSEGSGLERRWSARYLLLSCTLQSLYVGYFKPKLSDETNQYDLERLLFDVSSRASCDPNR